VDPFGCFGVGRKWAEWFGSADRDHDAIAEKTDREGQRVRLHGDRTAPPNSPGVSRSSWATLRPAVANHDWDIYSENAKTLPLRAAPAF
jgi:hypothetical protein